MSCGIYVIINEENNKKYVGQSINIENRWKQHLYDVTHRAERSCGIDMAMIKYGIEKFHYEILEECEPSELNDREIYWIEKLDTYQGDGYNRSIGGQSLQGENHPRAFLTDEQVWEIREMYNQHCKFKEVEEKYLPTGISRRGLQKIWRNETWTHIHQDVYTPENKLWHSTSGVGHSEDQVGLSSDDRKLSQEEVDAMYKDFQEGISVKELAKKYNRDYGIIEKYMSNPIVPKQVKLSGRKVKNIETGKIFSSISAAARWASCGATTLTRHLYDNKPAGKVPETQELAHWKEILE